MGIKVSNNAFATLAAGISSSATSITLTTGQGARFPTLGAGDYFYATLIDTSNNLEIVKCTARSTDVLTVTRAQEGTTARAYVAGDRIEIRLTAATFTDATAIADGDRGDITVSGSGTTWTIDNNAVTAAKMASTLDLSGKTLTLGTPNANGIKFPATQSASSDPNTLDDYEEGTWTTTFYAGATNLTGTPSLTRSTYTKIGRFVYLQGFITGYSVTAANTYTSFVMTLPIDMANNNDTPASTGYVFIGPMSTIGSFLDNTGSNTTQIAFIMPAALTTGTGAMGVAFSFSYIAAV